MSEPILDKFGALLMERVRDEAIAQWDMTINGQMKDAVSQRFHEMLGSFNVEQIEVLRLITPRIVDTTLHHMLWTLEQVPWVHLGVDSEHATVNSGCQVGRIPG